jgi:histidinol phosphatase-like enzyme
MTPTPESPFAPLPGTERSVRGLFVDRWGTLLDLPPRGSSLRFDPGKIFPGAVDALFRAQQAGWTVYLIGNEEAVAQGRWSDAAWERFEAALLQHLAAMGIDVARNYACLDHPEGVGAHCKPSVFLLPDTGLLYHAAQVDGVELRESWVVGDSSLELAAGGRAGCGTIGVRTGLALGDGRMKVEPDHAVADLCEALDLLVQAAART